jgi:uncharacterized membrane protein YfcA
MTVLGVGVGVVAVVALSLVVGAAVQGLVGLGLGLVAAPVVTLLEPSLMPALLLVLAAVLPLLTLVGDHDEIDWRGLAWVLPARLPGTALGVGFLALFSERALGVAVALMVLLAVVLSLAAIEVPVRPVTLAGAGVLSGATGTATSIGGPPVALLYQHRSPAQIRSTLAVLFTVGAAMSLVGLWLGGRLDPQVVLLALALTPCLALGALLGGWLQGVVPDHRIRYGVLAACGASALTLLVRSLLGS